MKYIIRILVWGFIVIHIGLLILLNVPFVQKKLSAAISSELSKLLNTEVSVGHIELGFLNRLHIEDVRLNDLEGDEMLNVHRLTTRPKPIPPQTLTAGISAASWSSPPTLPMAFPCRKRTFP